VTVTITVSVTVITPLLPGNDGVGAAPGRLESVGISREVKLEEAAELLGDEVWLVAEGVVLESRGALLGAGSATLGERVALVVTGGVTLADGVLLVAAGASPPEPEPPPGSDSSVTIGKSHSPLTRSVIRAVREAKSETAAV
jgi:hypothetical protein